MVRFLIVLLVLVYILLPGKPAL